MFKRNKLGRFVKGNHTWNKGIKGLHLNPKTEFKRGQLVGKKHPAWKGGVQRVEKDCTHLWVAVNKRVRRPRKVYEDYFGKIPKGLIIYHLDGNKDNDSIRNLIAISRAELIIFNRK